MAKEKLFIFDKDDNLLGVTSNYIEALFKESVNLPVSLSITYPTDDEKSDLFVGGNQVAFRDLRGRFRLFTIREVGDIDEGSPEKEVLCHPAIQELTDVIITEKRPQNKTAKYVLGVILEKSRWKVGKVAELGDGSTSFYYENAYDGLAKLTEVFGGEIVDRITISGSKITGRYIDLETRKGADTGKRAEIGKDIKSISRLALYYPKTALYGKGSALEAENDKGEKTGGYTRKITFKDVEWKKSKGDPVDKPLGQDWVGDEDARKTHGIPKSDGSGNAHRFGVFEDGDEKDPKVLLRKTWNAVQSEKTPKVQYEMEIETFYGIAGYEHEQVFVGDSMIARDFDVKPRIIVDSRVLSMTYDIGAPEEGTVVIGNFLEIPDPDEKDLGWVVDKVKDNSGKWDDGGTITNGKFPDIKPNRPTGVTAEGGFQTIMLHWDFTDEVYVNYYEVYGSQIKDFEPQEHHRLWKGKVSAFSHEVKTDQKWYYRVRAVNTHGTPSDYSAQVSASTVRILTEDILFGEDLAAELRELSKVADLLADDSISFDKISEEAKKLINEEPKRYTDEEVEAARKSLTERISEKADLNYVDGKLSDKIDVNEYLAKVGELTEVTQELDEEAGSIRQSVEETNVRIDNLDIRGTNFITHLPDKWEQGGLTFASASPNNAKNRIRLKKLYEISPNSDYTITRYEEATVLAIYLYKRDGTYTRAVHIGYSDEEEFATFKTAADEHKFRIMVGADTDITPDDIGNRLRVKLSFGTESSGWTPNLDDTGQLVANVQEYVSKFEQTSKEIKSEVSALEIDVKNNEKAVSDVKSIAKQNADEIAWKVDSKKYETDKDGIIKRLDSSDAKIELNEKAIKFKADKTYVDNATDSIENSVAELNVKYDEISSTVSNIRVGGRNLLQYTDFSKDESVDDWYSWLNIVGGIRKQKVGNYDFLRVGVTADVEEGQMPRIRTPYRYRLTDGETYTVSWIGFTSDWVSSNFNSCGIYYNGAIRESFNNAKRERIDTVSYSGFNKPVYKFTYTFKYTGSTENPSEDDIAIFMGTESLNGRSAYFLFSQLQLEHGSVASDWQPAFEDSERRMSKSESRITQLSDEIELKVDSDSIVSEINLSREGIRLKGSLIELDGNTLIRNGVIGTAAIANAAITKAKLGTAIVGTAQIENLAVTSAKIKSVNADKVNASSLAAITANLGTVTAGILKSKNSRVTFNLNQSRLDMAGTGTQSLRLDDTGLTSRDNKGNIRIHLGIRNISGKGQSDPSTIRFFAGSGSTSAGVGMNVNDTFVIGSSSSKVAMELHSGKNTIVYAAQLRVKPNKTSSGEYLVIDDVNNTGGTAKEVRIRPASSGSGYLGSKGYRWWRTYVNHLHYLEQHKLSSREFKTDIEVLDITKAKEVFDALKLKTFRYFNTNGEASANISYGVITDEAPKEILDSEEESVNQDNYIGVIAGAVKYDSTRIDNVTDEVDELKAKIERLESEITELKER